MMMIGKKYFYTVLILISAHFSLVAQSAFYSHPEKNRDIVFFMSTPKSGTNLVTGSLCALTRKPICWFHGADALNDPKQRNSISWNRLGVPLVNKTPLLYRTHYQFAELMQVPSSLNKLIFLTRNPKELLYRKYYLEPACGNDPDWEFMTKFLARYLKAFEIFDAWCPENRRLLFYEDFIQHDMESLLHLLKFMKEEPLFLEDFQNNKEAYLAKLLASYSQQHLHNLGDIA